MQSLRNAKVTADVMCNRKRLLGLSQVDIKHGRVKRGFKLLLPASLF